MTTQEKLKIRTELANILVQYGAIKGKLERQDAPQEFKDEAELLNQLWHQTFIIWYKLEQAMTLNNVPYNQIDPAIAQSTSVFNETLVKINKCIESKG